MTKHPDELSVEELLAIAAKPASKKDEEVLDDVSAWVMRENIKPGEYQLRIGTAYEMYRRWSLGAYDRKKFTLLMRKKFEGNKIYFLVEEEGIEKARAKLLSEIGVKYNGKKTKAKRKI